jgi:hypothetical protein
MQPARLKADTRNAAGDVLSGKGRKATRTPAVLAAGISRRPAPKRQQAFLSTLTANPRRRSSRCWNWLGRRGEVRTMDDGRRMAKVC